MSLKIQYFPSQNFLLRNFFFFLFENFVISKNDVISVEAARYYYGIWFCRELLVFFFFFFIFQNWKIVSSNVLWNEDENFSVNVADGSWSDEIRDWGES
jgi:hypothetical protein